MPNPKDLRRHIYFNKAMQVFIVAAYFELPEKRLVMAIKTHKQKSMAVNLAMKAAKERTLAGEFQEVKRRPPIRASREG